MNKKRTSKRKKNAINENRGQKPGTTVEFTVAWKGKEQQNTILSYLRIFPGGLNLNAANPRRCSVLVFTCSSNC
jgi:hypothetical protein